MVQWLHKFTDSKDINLLQMLFSLHVEYYYFWIQIINKIYISLQNKKKILSLTNQTTRNDKNKCLQYNDNLIFALIISSEQKSLI